MKRFITIWVLTVVATSSQAAMTAEDVVGCMKKNFPATASIRNIELTTTDATGGSSTMAGRVYAQMEPQEDGRALLRGTMVIERPKNLYGAAYLVRETDDYLRDGMFVFMPAVGRVRRISGNFADGPMMGTKFSYFEFKQMSSAFGDLKGNYLREEKTDGRTSHVLEFKPLPGIETRYSSVTAWIDSATCLIAKAEFKQGNKVVKNMIAPASGLMKSGNQWYHNKILMHDLTDDAKTLMVIDNVTTNEELSSYRFHPRTFYQTR